MPSEATVVVGVGAAAAEPTVRSVAPPTSEVTEPPSEAISGTRHFGQTVSPFAYQDQQVRQTAWLNDAPRGHQRIAGLFPARPNSGAVGKLDSMSLTRTLTRFVFLAAIGHQVTYTFVEGGIFEDVRRRLSAIDPKVEEFVHCHLCVGTWVGMLLAGIYRPNLLADVDGKPPSFARQVANVAGDAFLIALGTRIWNEGLGWLRREVQVKQKTIEAVEEAQHTEEDQPALPRISIRAKR